MRKKIKAKFCKNIKAIIKHRIQRFQKYYNKNHKNNYHQIIK